MYDISKLVRVSTYARKIKKSVVWIYQLAKKGDIKIVEIDGVKFVNL